MPNDAEFPLSLCSPALRGSRVGEAQYLLKKNRHGVNFHPGPMDGVYGPQTAAAARRAKFYLGYPLDEVHGTFGWVLLSFLVEKTHPRHKRRPMDFRIRAARRQRRVGIREKSV